MKKWFVALCISVSFGFSGLLGCGSSGFSSTEGVVTLDGQPLANATVMFQSPNMPMATARTNQDGKYRVETGGTKGIKPGEYSVTVAAYAKGKNGGERAPNLIIPQRYLQPETSGLKAEIGSGTNRDVNFELVSTPSN